MITYKKLRHGHNPIMDYIIIKINRITLKMAQKNCRQIAKHEQRPHYIVDMNDLWIMLNSTEKDDINRKMPRGAAMNIAEFYRHVIYKTDRHGNPVGDHV